MSIVDFKCADTEHLFTSGKSKRFASIQSVAERKLVQLEAASSLASLRAPPGNRLESLTGDRAGQHSIRINDQWRLCFVWTAQGPAHVEIVDYH
jgi:proteic killer suppression protein